MLTRRAALPILLADGRPGPKVATIRTTIAPPSESLRRAIRGAATGRPGELISWREPRSRQVRKRCGSDDVAVGEHVSSMHADAGSHYCQRMACLIQRAAGNRLRHLQCV